MSSILDFLEDLPWFAIIGAICLVAVIALIIAGETATEKEWQQYAQEHHCKKVGTKEGKVNPGISSNGEFVAVWDSDQDIYKCDNDEVVIR